MLKDFLADYGLSIVYAALTAVAGAVGVWVKRLFVRCENEKTKRDVAELCVQAVEQGCRDLHGAQKFQECAQTMAQMLASRGVPVTDVEIRVLCEAALARFNQAFSSRSAVRCENE